MILNFDLKVHINSSLIGKYVVPITMDIDHHKFVNFLQLINNFTMMVAKTMLHY